MPKNADKFCIKLKIAQMLLIFYIFFGSNVLGINKKLAESKNSTTFLIFF